MNILDKKRRLKTWHGEGEELDIGSDAVYKVLVMEKDAEKEGPTKVVHGQFGCRWMHNEQLIIAPCRMILAHETFTFSEVFSLVAVCVCFTLIFFNSNDPSRNLCMKLSAVISMAHKNDMLQTSSSLTPTV